MFRTTLYRLPVRQAFHTNAIIREEWTKASLRRMKKVELTRLAKDNHLNYSGTKNDIIIELLTHQTAKIVGTTTPAPRTIDKVIQDTPPVQETTQIEDTAQTMDKVEEPELDDAWMNAFEMKVAQRGSRKPMDESNDHFTSGTKTSKPHRFNDQIKPKVLLEPEQDRPKPTSHVSSVPSTKTFTLKTDEVELEGMDSQWVEAFDLKVGSRGARSLLTDTLSPTTTPSPIDELEFITVDKKEPSETTKAVENKPTEEIKEKVEKPKPVVGKKFDHVGHHTEKHGKKHYHNDNKAKEKENSIPDNNSNNRDAMINTAVGSGMVVWYFGEGLSKIWHFLSSSL